VESGGTGIIAVPPLIPDVGGAVEGKMRHGCRSEDLKTDLEKDTCKEEPAPD
jgi:hypothetical protein